MRKAPTAVMVPPVHVSAPVACEASKIGWKVPGMFARTGDSGIVATSISAASCGSKKWPQLRHPAESRHREPLFMF
jgi:hypothetical protein